MKCLACSEKHGTARHDTWVSFSGARLVVVGQPADACKLENQLSCKLIKTA